MLSKLELRIQQLSCDQMNIREQNQQLRSLNIQLQEQVESSKEKLQAALGQLSLLQLSAAQEQVVRQRWVADKSQRLEQKETGSWKAWQVFCLDNTVFI